MTKNEIVAQLKVEYPTLKKGNNQDGYEDIAGEEYETIISSWADNLLEEQTKQAEESAKAAARQALLDKLGITADEAKLLLS